MLVDTQMLVLSSWQQKHASKLRKGRKGPELLRRCLYTIVIGRSSDSVSVGARKLPLWLLWTGRGASQPEVSWEAGVWRRFSSGAKAAWKLSKRMRSSSIIMVKERIKRVVIRRLRRIWSCKISWVRVRSTVVSFRLIVFLSECSECVNSWDWSWWGWNRGRDVPVHVKLWQRMRRKVKSKIPIVSDGYFTYSQRIENRPTLFQRAFSVGCRHVSSCSRVEGATESYLDYSRMHPGRCWRIASYFQYQRLVSWIHHLRRHERRIYYQIHL